MANFSLLIQKKYFELNPTHKRIFSDEFERRKKSKSFAFLLWLLFGWHYAYVKKWGLLLLFIFTLGGFFIWWIVDFFRVSKIVDEYNNDLALEILRDITVMFGREDKVLNIGEVKENRNAGNDFYLTNNNKSEESYLSIIIPVVLTLIIVISAFMKPDKLKMENKIVDKMLEHNPEMVIIMKNFFFGKEMKEEYVNNFISNTLKKKGYRNLEFYEGDWVVLRKIELIDKTSNKFLINAYGIFGTTFISLNYDDDKSSDNFNTTFVNPTKPEYQPIGNTKEYLPTKGKIEHNENNIVEEKQSELLGDSIKIN